MLSYETQKIGLLATTPTAFGGLLNRNAVAAMNDLGVGGRARVRVGIPQHGGDSYWNSIKLDRATFSTGAVINLHTESPIAIFREVDTKPHVIVPVNKKALRFTMGRTIVFARKVNHPGTKGLHNWQYANQQLRLRLPFAVHDAVEAALKMQPYAKRYS